MIIIIILGSAIMGLELRHNDDDVDCDGEVDQNHHSNHHHYDNNHYIRLRTHRIRASP